MKRLEVSGAVRPLYGSLGFKELMWRVWCAPNNANKRQMGFNLAFRGLNLAKFVYHYAT